MQQGRTYNRVPGWPGDKGTHKGRSYGDRAWRRGRIDMRPDPFPSTTLLFYLWQRLDPREPGTAHPGIRFSPVTRQTVRIVFVNNFCSGSVFSLVRRAFCNRVEHAQDGRSVSVNNYWFLPLEAA